MAMLSSFTYPMESSPLSTFSLFMVPASEPKLSLSLSCPAIGCRHLYLPIRNNLGAWSQGPRADSRSLGAALSIIIDNKLSIVSTFCSPLLISISGGVAWYCGKLPENSILERGSHGMTPLTHLEAILSGVPVLACAKP